ncbi:hypothetical protein D3C76_1124090 [compost metagenome]
MPIAAPEAEHRQDQSAGEHLQAEAHPTGAEGRALAQQPRTDGPEQGGHDHQAAGEPLLESRSVAEPIAHQHHDAAAGQGQAAEDPQWRAPIQQPFQGDAPEGQGGVEHRQHAGRQELVGVDQRSLSHGNQHYTANQCAPQVTALDLRLATGQHPAQGQGAGEEEAQGGDGEGWQFAEEEVVGEVGGAPADVDHGEGADQQNGATGCCLGGHVQPETQRAGCPARN